MDFLSWVARALGIALFGMFLYYWAVPLVQAIPAYHYRDDDINLFIILVPIFAFATACTVVLNLSLWMPAGKPKTSAGSFIRIGSCVIALPASVVFLLGAPIAIGNSDYEGLFFFGIFRYILLLNTYLAVAWVNLREYLSPLLFWRELQIRFGFSAITLLIGANFFLSPGIEAFSNVYDSKLFSPQIPSAAWQLHARLATEIPDLATVSPTDFVPYPQLALYLRSIESLQKACKADHSLAPVAAMDSAAISEWFYLVDWEKKIERLQALTSVDEDGGLTVNPQNLYFADGGRRGPEEPNPDPFLARLYLISLLSSYLSLTSDLPQRAHYLDLLRDQVNRESEEIAHSPDGRVLTSSSDEPPLTWQPWNEIEALAAIHRADGVLQTDHSILLEQARRAFVGGMPRDETTYFKYMQGLIVIDAEEIWPDLGDKWYHQYQHDLWHEELGFVGFGKSGDAEDYTFLTFSIPDSEMGLGAAREHGRFDQAGPLAAELILLQPGFSFKDKIYLLYSLTRQPAEAGIPTQPLFTLAVYCGLVYYFGGALLLTLPTISFLRWLLR